MSKQLLKVAVLAMAVAFSGSVVAANSAKSTKANADKKSSTTYAMPTTPLAVPAGNPGMRNPDGSIHKPHTPNVAPNMINVVERAAALGLKIDLADSDFDDLPAIEAVYQDAETKEGSTLFFPKGTYNLVSTGKDTKYEHFRFEKNKVNWEGESREDTIFKTHQVNKGNKKNFYGFNLKGVHDVVLKNFTFTSTWTGNYSIDTTINNPDGGGLSYVIATGASGESPAYNITIDGVIVEKYKKMGIRIAAGSHDITVRNSVIRNTTDVGPKGSGYGIVVQGDGNVNADKNPFLGNKFADVYFVLIENNRSEGPYVRHAALIQYWAHNNLVTKNYFEKTRLDAIDLHGEDEYANEISHNTVTFSERAGIALGNSGASHDKTGVDNWIHSNDLISNNTGISVEYGTDRSVIERNLIRDNKNHSVEKGYTCGVFLGKSAKSILRDNVIINNTVPGFFGILFVDSKKMGTEEMGSPVGWKISGNKVINSGTPFFDQSTMAADNQVQKTW